MVWWLSCSTCLFHRRLIQQLHSWVQMLLFLGHMTNKRGQRSVKEHLCKQNKVKVKSQERRRREGWRFNNRDKKTETMWNAGWCGVWKHQRVCWCWHGLPLLLPWLQDSVSCVQTGKNKVSVDWMETWLLWEGNLPLPAGSYKIRLWIIKHCICLRLKVCSLQTRV